MRLDPRAARVVERYLAAVDDALPGLVAEAYVVGSAVQDDFRVGTSDVNFVAVVAEAFSPPTSEAVAKVHRRLARSYPAVPLDGVYLNRSEMMAAGQTVSGPHVRCGAFMPDGEHGRTALAWQAFVDCGEPVRGDGTPTPPAWLSAKRVDEAVLAQASEIAKLTMLAERSPDPPSQQALGSRVLEASRLHFTLATAALTSKTKAGLYGLVTFDGEWTPLIDAALQTRREPRSTSRLTVERTFEFVQMVATDMHALVSFR